MGRDKGPAPIQGQALFIRYVRVYKAFFSLTFLVIMLISFQN